MLNSAQIIANSQASVSTALNTLLQYIPSGSIQNMYANVFGANQFLITVIYTWTGGLRKFSFSNNVGAKAFLRAKQKPTRIKLSLGLKAASTKYKNGNVI